MKKKFFKAEVEVIRFEKNDIITTNTESIPFNYDTEQMEETEESSFFWLV